MVVVVVHPAASAFAGFVINGFSAFLPLIFQLQYSIAAGTAAVVSPALVHHVERGLSLRQLALC